MSLLVKIKSAQLQARKDRNTVAANLLTTLIGEAEAIGKNAGNRDTTDLEVVAVIKKFIKNINELVGVLQPGQSDIAIAQANTEKTLLEQYLPTQLSGEELKAVLVMISTELGAHTLRDMGRIMKVLKERYDGQYDGAAASTLIKVVLQ